MKKLFILAAGLFALGLGSCKKELCPAYSSVKSSSAPVVASAATPAARQ